ncbi:hypothetical protein TL16_g07852 [Triparma laevis f. inornata]|uniref:Uncharacterized protein n=1 Tax=Triparma laevis f. inornata TaxID=1714386 RepID=A0A9W7ASX9_9STRA|nr:hypothetical protein TL16_g07852 [Triparma laevis f. inornata]
MWRRKRQIKDEERWELLDCHSTYIPFDVVTPWICEELVSKYDDKSVKRPDWMSGKGRKSKCIKRIAAIYTWYVKDEEEVNYALNTQFEKCGKNFEEGRADGLSSLTYIKSKKKKYVGRIKVKSAGGLLIF